MYESAFGPMSLFYNEYSYGTKESGVYLKRVIYIPEDSEDIYYPIESEGNYYNIKIGNRTYIC